MKNGIKWQKYEDALEKQLNSTFLKDTVMQGMSSEMLEALENMTGNEDEDDISYSSQETVLVPIPVPIPQDLSEEIGLITGYDCWIGHANFVITDDIKEQLDKIKGIEVLKVCSRYRFFIGVGQMFKFSNVRVDIEEKFTSN